MPFFIGVSVKRTASLIRFLPLALLIIGAVCLVCITNVSAQQAATATLSGRVLDPNGAAVSGATVTVSQKATGFERSVTTSGEGVYVLTNLPAAEYEVKAKPGLCRQLGNGGSSGPERNPQSSLNRQWSSDEQFGRSVRSSNRHHCWSLTVSFTRAMEGLPLNGRNFSNWHY